MRRGVGTGGPRGRAPRLGTQARRVTEGVTRPSAHAQAWASSRVRWRHRQSGVWWKRAQAEVLGRGLRFTEGKGLQGRKAAGGSCGYAGPGGGDRKGQLEAARECTRVLGRRSPQDLGSRETEREAEGERAAWGSGCWGELHRGHPRAHGESGSSGVAAAPRCLRSSRRNPREWQGHSPWPSASSGGQRHPVSGGILPSPQGGACPCLFPDTSGGRGRGDGGVRGAPHPHLPAWAWGTQGSDAVAMPLSQRAGVNELHSQP